MVKGNRNTTDMKGREIGALIIKLGGRPIKEREGRGKIINKDVWKAIKNYIILDLQLHIVNISVFVYIKI